MLAILLGMHCLHAQLPGMLYYCVITFASQHISCTPHYPGPNILNGVQIWTVPWPPLQQIYVELPTRIPFINHSFGNIVGGVPILLQAKT
jgi:hypothetical protein